MVSKEDLRKRRDFARRREIVESSKNPFATPLLNKEEEITRELAIADRGMKKGNYHMAFRSLNYALKGIEDLGDDYPQRDKYLSSTQNRINRLNNKLPLIERRDITLAAKVRDLAYRLERSKEARKSSRTHSITTYVSVIIGIIGLLGAILFASPNVTGNAIGKLNQVNSNTLGIVFFIIGLTGIFLYSKFR